MISVQPRLELSLVVSSLESQGFLPRLNGGFDRNGPVAIVPRELLLPTCEPKGVPLLGSHFSILSGDPPLDPSTKVHTLYVKNSLFLYFVSFCTPILPS